MLPAHAGMILKSIPCASASSSAPRACGDDPMKFLPTLDLAECSPRMRG